MPAAGGSRRPQDGARTAGGVRGKSGVRERPLGPPRFPSADGVQSTSEPIRYTTAEADITSRAIIIRPSDSHPLRISALRDLDRISMSRISGGAASPLRIAET